MEEEACKKRRVVPIPSPMTSRFNLPDKNVCTPFHFHSKLGHCASPPRGCRNFIFIKWIHGNGCPSFTNRVHSVAASVLPFLFFFFFFFCFELEFEKTRRRIERGRKNLTKFIIEERKKFRCLIIQEKPID